MNAISNDGPETTSAIPPSTSGSNGAGTLPRNVSTPATPTARLPTATLSNATTLGSNSGLDGAAPDAGAAPAPAANCAWALESAAEARLAMVLFDRAVPVSYRAPKTPAAG